MSCCKGSTVATEDPDPKDFFFKKRGCTDVICLILFVACLGGVGFVCSLAITWGDQYSIFYGADYLGNRCGVGEYADKPKVFYPRVDKDVQQQIDIAATTPWAMKFYGLCMKECPSVEKPEDCFEDPGSCVVKDYGEPEQYAKVGGASQYYATMPMIDVINRCIPKNSESYEQDDTRCAFPQCGSDDFNDLEIDAPCDTTYPTTWIMSDDTIEKCDVRFVTGEIKQLRATTSDTLSRSIGQNVQGLAEAAQAVQESYLEVLLFGLAMPVVCGFLWLVFLRFFAGTVIYTGLIALGVVLFAFTLYCFASAGLLSVITASVLDVDSANSSVSGDSAYAAALGASASAEQSIVSVVADSADDAEAGATAQDPTVWIVIGAISLLFTFLYVLTMCMARKKIKKTVALVKASTSVVKDRPATMVFPFGTLIMQILLLLFFVGLLVLLVTADLDPSHFTSATPSPASGSSFVDAIAWYNATLKTEGAEGIAAREAAKSQVQIGVYAFVLFMFLWCLQMIGNIAWTTMAGNVGHWYFFREDEDVRTKIPLLRSLGRVLLYHMGTIAAGSFIVAVIQFLRIVLLAIDKYTKKYQEKSLVVRLAFKCCACCMACLERCIKYITDYCYIYVALQGCGFCKACFLTFSLIMNNMLQVTLNNTVRSILKWIQILMIPTASAWVGNAVLILNGRKDPMITTIFVAFMALVITSAFATVFSCILDTLFICCLRDKDAFEARHMPSVLRSAYGFDKKPKKEKEEEPLEE